MTFKVTKLLTTTVIASLSVCALAAPTQAQTISGAFNADNRYMVTVSEGTGSGSNSTVHTTPSSYTWGSYADRFSFNLADHVKDTSNLKQCRVNVIVWGDGSVAEGLAGVLRGDNGIIHTGSGGFSAKDSGVTSGGFSGVPNQATIDTISPAAISSGSVTNLGAANSHPTWGNVQTFYNSTDFNGMTQNLQWIRPSAAGTTTRNYWVFSTGCGDLVKPTPKPVQPIDVPGEHYQCYAIEKGDNLKNETLYIEDQFGGSKTVLGHPVMLCNPSTKTHGRKSYKIQDEKRHLVCYNHVQSEEVRSQRLLVNNQMGPDEVYTGRREMFCVPSYKYHYDDRGNVIMDEEKEPGTGFGRAIPSRATEGMRRLDFKR